jgi:hypothetical protein
MQDRLASPSCGVRSIVLVFEEWPHRRRGWTIHRSTGVGHYRHGPDEMYKMHFAG